VAVDGDRQTAGDDPPALRGSDGSRADPGRVALRGGPRPRRPPALRGRPGHARCHLLRGLHPLRE
jgi:hypothetical protein